MTGLERMEIDSWDCEVDSLSCERCFETAEQDDQRYGKITIAQGNLLLIVKTVFVVSQ